MCWHVRGWAVECQGGLKGPRFGVFEETRWRDRRNVEQQRAKKGKKSAQDERKGPESYRGAGMSC